MLPAIHLEDPSDVHVIKKRSLDQQLRIKLYYDESVYRFVVSLTKNPLVQDLQWCFFSSAKIWKDEAESH